MGFKYMRWPYQMIKAILIIHMEGFRVIANAAQKVNAEMHRK